MMVLCLLAALATAAADPRDAAQKWTCVPGDNGRWRCGEGAAEPETSPLPELPEAEPATSPPSIFILEQPHSSASPLAPADAEPAVQGSHPLLGNPDPAGPFALKIASVSRVEEIAGFVENYGLDPTLVRYVEIDEDGTPRQLILWGAFASADQAARAVNGLPGVVRSVRPQVIRADRFDQPPRMLLAADGPAASLPDEPAPEVTAPIAAVDSEPAPAPRIAASESEPALDPAPSNPVTPEPEAEPEVAVTTPPAPAPSVTRAKPEPASEPVRPRSRAAPVDSPGAVAVPPPGRPADEFRALAAEGYTVQLTSLRDAALIERFLRHHSLDPTRVYRIRVDEGAGPRWLLLWGWYPTLEGAQTDRDALPGSIRSPWVRRVGPLIERLDGEENP